MHIRDGEDRVIRIFLSVRESALIFCKWVQSKDPVSENTRAVPKQILKWSHWPMKLPNAMDREVAGRKPRQTVAEPLILWNWGNWGRGLCKPIAWRIGCMHDSVR